MYYSNLFSFNVAIPDTTVVSTAYGHLALRLKFRAEHTNVLIVQADVLQGCLVETEVEKMDMQLILQERPVPWVSSILITIYVVHVLALMHVHVHVCTCTCAVHCVIVFLFRY